MYLRHLIDGIDTLIGIFIDALIDILGAGAIIATILFCMVALIRFLYLTIKAK